MKEQKKISINFIYQVAYQLLTILLPLITAPYIARVLGAENTGIYSYTYVIASYFLIFAALGIESYGNRMIAQAKMIGQEEVNKTFSSIFYVHVIVSIIAIIIYFIYVLFFMEQYQTIALLQSFWVISALFDVNWFFFGIEEFKLTVTRNTVVKIATVCAMFIFVHTKADLWKYTLIMALGSLISQCVIWIFLPRHVRFIKVSIKDSLIHLKPICILFLGVIATSLYRMIDKVMLGVIGDMNDLGSYEYADRLIKMIVTLITALGTVMLPRMSALYAHKQEKIAEKYLNSTSQFIFVISFALAFGLSGIADEFIVLFLGDGYESTISVVKILTISIPFMGWNNLIRTQILIPKSKDLVYTRAVWSGAIINIILNIVLIYSMGVNGAAIATVISYFIVSIFQTVPIIEEYNILKYLKYSISPFLFGIIMYIIIRFIGNKLGVGIITVIIQIIFGAIVYLILNGIYLMKSKNEVFIKYIYKSYRILVKR